MPAQLDIFDAIILAVVGLSALIAFFRGFIRELLSLGAWVGAAIITIYFFPHATSMMQQHVKSDHVAAGIAALGTYIAALLGISILNSVIIRYVKTGAEVGLLDNFLGLVFGTMRGMFIVVLGFLVMTAAINKDSPPPWLKQSFTRPYLQQGADFMVAVAPQYLHELEIMVKHEKENAEKAKEEGGDASNLPNYSNGMGPGTNDMIPQGTAPEGTNGQPYVR